MGSDGVIAPLWANLDITRSSTATIHVRTLGSAPTRRFVVQWSDVPLAADPASRLTFQVALFEGTGTIELRYQSLRNGDGSTGGAAGGGTATIGVEDCAGLQGLLVARNAPGAVADSATVLEDASATAVAVLTNDTDVDAGPKTISSASDPANGTVALTRAQLSMLLEGIDWRHPVRTAPPAMAV